MHFEQDILVVGDHRLKLSDLDGFQEIHPEGRPPYTMACHHDGWQTILFVPLADIDELFQKQPTRVKKGWALLLDDSNRRCLINIGKLSARPSQGALGSVRGYTEFSTTIWNWIYKVGHKCSFANFLQMIRPLAMNGRGWEIITATPLKPVFRPSGKRGPRSKTVTKEAA